MNYALTMQNATKTSRQHSFNPVLVLHMFHIHVHSTIIQNRIEQKLSNNRNSLKQRVQRGVKEV